MKNLLYVLGLLLLVGCSSAKDGDTATQPIQVVEGFEVQKIYSPSDSGEGSWVAMCEDNQGRLITSDQYGYLYRVTLNEPSVEKLEVEIGQANGLLYAFDALYVMVNGDDRIEGRGSGLYRLKDTKGDDEFDEITLLKKFEGWGEHGPHNIILSPDGNSLYLIAGNHTKIPEFDHYYLPKVWGEDNLLPVMKDARGHANDITAPGGWVAKIQPDGSDFELVASGFRNTYDMAFNKAGDLFAFDSDMEWDLGMPWYRPIRLLHVTSGAEFGWRTGSGKWSVDYPDNLPSVLDVGQGSPTGVFFGYNGNFPKKYRESMFLFDWSFGTIYTVELSPKGASYSGQKQEFLSGAPLPITDGIVASDGNIYFLTGGRKLQSDLYRVKYVGESTSKDEESSVSLTESNQVRRQLEGLHRRFVNPNIQFPLDQLSNEDRHVRYAARVAIEHQDPRIWRNKLTDDLSTKAKLGLALATARVDSKYSQTAFDRLMGIEFEALDRLDQFALIRAFNLLMIRGAIVEESKTQLLTKMDSNFPSDDPWLNRELVAMLSYLGSSEVASKTVALMKPEAKEDFEMLYLDESVTGRSHQYGKDIEAMLANAPDAQKLSYAQSLSHLKNGWTDDSRKIYFEWLRSAFAKKAGLSFNGFLEKIKAYAFENVSNDPDKFQTMFGFDHVPAVDFSALPKPKGPGKNYQLEEVKAIMGSGLEGDMVNGAKMYEAALCSSCHSFKGKGGNVGPTLDGLSSKFSDWDLYPAILYPSMSISDQYAAEEFEMKDGSSMYGRVLDESESEVMVNNNPYVPTQTVALAKSDIVKRQISAVSTMPAGLLNRLNEQEIVDLMTYLKQR